MTQPLAGAEGCPIVKAHGKEIIRISVAGYGGRDLEIPTKKNM